MSGWTILAVYLVGLIPAIYISGRRYASWRRDGYNAELMACWAPMAWPLWLAIALLLIAGRMIAPPIAWIWLQGRGHGHPTPAAPSDTGKE